MTDQQQLHDLFPNLEEGLYEEIVPHGEIKEVPAGTTLLKIGQTIRSTMLILEGVVKLYQEDDEGNEFFIYHIQPGQACAVSMVCSYQAEQSQVMARTLTDVTLLTIPLEYMDKWLAKYKSWHYFVIRTYRSRYEELLKTINEIAFKNMDEGLSTCSARLSNSVTSELDPPGNSERPEFLPGSDQWFDEKNGTERLDHHAPELY